MKNESVEQVLKKTYELFIKKSSRRTEILENKPVILSVLNMLDKQINDFNEVDVESDDLLNSESARDELVKSYNDMNKELSKLEQEIPALQLYLCVLNEILTNSLDSKEIMFTYNDNRVETNKLR